MIKTLVVMGTRPEAIKMGSLVHTLKKSNSLQVEVCATGQHRDLLDTMMQTFEIKPQYDLDILKSGADLAENTSQILLGMRNTIRQAKPNLVLVQGDTTSCMASALAAFYEHCPVGHVEAGLRTGNLEAPWPEEFNRKATGVVTRFHFAPTRTAANNLLREGMRESDIYITGNTVIDSLQWISRKLDEEKALLTDLSSRFSNLDENRPLILVTLHRRENLGAGLDKICEALCRITREREVQIILPVHPNPSVADTIRLKLSGQPEIHLVQPQDYLTFVYLMKLCRFIISDSGGIQEEAPALGKPVLVAREVTERPEAVEAGCARLVGSDPDRICTEAFRLLDDAEAYKHMATAANPFGDGKACERIREIIEHSFSNHPN